MVRLLGDRRRRWIARALAVLGVGTVGVAVLLGAFQGVLPAAYRDPIAAVAETLGRDGVAWALALVGACYALWRVFRGRRRDPVAPEFAADPPEQSSVDVARTGTRFESSLEAVAADVDHPTEDGQAFRDALRDLAVDVIRRTDGRSEAAVRDRVATGEWTDDRIAAAFLGGEDAPGYPLRARIRGWLRPTAAFERRAERSVAAIRGRLDVDATPADEEVGGASGRTSDDRTPATEVSP